jgi:hypothetical protein
MREILRFCGVPRGARYDGAAACTKRPALRESHERPNCRPQADLSVMLSPSLGDASWLPGTSAMGGTNGDPQVLIVVPTGSHGPRFGACPLANAIVTDHVHHAAARRSRTGVVDTNQPVRESANQRERQHLRTPPLS